VEITRQLNIREKGLVANIRTAAMLFVVTAVFIVAFLPAWLMAHKLVPYNMVIFYGYFAYNVANPIVYAFMNKTFRRDLKDVFDCRHANNGLPPP
jgi:cholecystokinin A receptor